RREAELPGAFELVQCAAARQKVAERLFARAAVPAFCGEVPIVGYLGLLAQAVVRRGKPIGAIAQPVSNVGKERGGEVLREIFTGRIESLTQRGFADLNANFKLKQEKIRITIEVGFID